LCTSLCARERLVMCECLCGREGTNAYFICCVIVLISIVSFVLSLCCSSGQLRTSQFLSWQLVTVFVYDINALFSFHLFFFLFGCSVKDVFIFSSWIWTHLQKIDCHFIQFWLGYFVSDCLVKYTILSGYCQTHVDLRENVIKFLQSQQVVHPQIWDLNVMAIYYVCIGPVRVALMFSLLGKRLFKWKQTYNIVLVRSCWMGKEEHEVFIFRGMKKHWL